MKRSLQEVVELVVFGLIALLIGTGVLWLLGWVLGLVGLLFKVVAGLVWWLLRFIVPVAIVAGLVYFLVRMAQNQGDKQAASPTPPVPPTVHPPVPPTTPTSAAGTDPLTPGAAAYDVDPAATDGGSEPTRATTATDLSEDAPSTPDSVDGSDLDENDDTRG